MNVVEKLKTLVATERKITAEIIEHIQEIDRKKIFAQMGYPSLFAFLTDYIGYSGSAAQRRIEAARLISEVPTLKEEIKSGELNLSQVSLVAKCVRQKQKEVPMVHIKAEDKRDLLNQIKNQSFESSQKILSQTLDLEIKSFDKKVVQKDESVRLEVTLTKEQMDAFTKVKSMISHSNPNATVAEVFEYLANDYLQRKLKPANANKSAVVKPLVAQDIQGLNGSNNLLTNARHRATESVVNKAKPNDSKTTCGSFNSSVNTRARKHIPLNVKRYVWQRDQGKCQHKANRDGVSKICGSSHMLQLDHIKRVRHGGSNDSNNLQLLCFTHNQLKG